MSSKKKNIFNPDFVFEDTSPFNSDLNGNSEVIQWMRNFN